MNYKLAWHIRLRKLIEPKLWVLSLLGGIGMALSAFTMLIQIIPAINSGYAPLTKSLRISGYMIFFLLLLQSLGYIAAAVFDYLRKQQEKNSQEKEVILK